MADFEAPSGPPPPKVPEGWVARWNDQYKEWFFVNTFTKKSQWEKPTAPAHPPADDDGPAGPPPSYTSGGKLAPTDTKTNPFSNSSNSNLSGAGSSSRSEIDDAELARKLQAEEDAKARTGAAASYAAGADTSGSAGSSFPAQLPARDGDKQRGFLGKLFGKNKTSGVGYPGAGYGQPQYGGSQYGSPAPQHYQGYSAPSGYGGYPSQGGYAPQGGYYQQGPPAGYYGGGQYPPQQQYGRPAGGGGGLGTAGGAALGLGAGLVGGMLLEDAIDDHDQEMYQDGYQNGADNGDGGGDYGGGDDGGGGDF